MGSMKSWFVTMTSGIQIAQRRCAHFPAPVCLKAPPSFGHNTQLYGNDQIGQRIKSIHYPRQVSLERQCTSDRATAPLECKELRSNLDGPPNCIHRSRQ